MNASSTLKVCRIGAALLFSGVITGAALAAGPAFDCGKAEGQVETLICRDAALSALDRQLVAATPAVTYACDGDARNEIIVTFFQTDPPSLIAERGDSVSRMILQRSGSGAKYQGRNASFWEHHGEALVTWGVGAPEMRCQKR